MKIFELFSEATVTTKPGKEPVKDTLPKYETYEYGNWVIKTSTRPVRSPQTNNELLYLSVGQHKRLTDKSNYIVGTGKNELEARDNVIAQIRTKGRPDNVDMYKHFDVVLNTNFTTEYFPQKMPGYFKFGEHDSIPVLIMAGPEFYSVYKDEMIQQGFHVARKKNNPEIDYNGFMFSCSRAELKRSGMVLFGRYAVMEPSEDQDGNYVFELVFDSQTLGVNDKVRMGIPGITISGSTAVAEDAPTIASATSKSGNINRATANRMVDPKGDFPATHKKPY